MIDVGNDGEISDVIHGPLIVHREARFAEVKTAQPFQRKLTSLADVKAQERRAELKKRHVERLTRLPTKRMATACWAFIVAKRTPRETAPLLDFLPLQCANIKIYKQVIHKSMWMAWG
ncbi:MAG TPA: hypothetical protein VJ598_00760 [Albitalea sp.]|nr:hypothetical protein [Albitalea sp.]